MRIVGRVGPAPSANVQSSDKVSTRAGAASATARAISPPMECPTT